MLTLQRYLRRRRLAIVASIASAGLLAAWLLLGAFPETYSHPVLLPGSDGLRVGHRAGRVHEDEIVHYLLDLDRQTLAIRDRTWFYGDALVLVRTPEGVTAFSEQTYGPVPQSGNLERLDQDWAVLAAARAPDSGTIWLFGTRGEEIVARPLDGRAAGPVERVAALGSPVDSMKATIEAASGPTIAWQEQGSSIVKCARRGPSGFAPLASCDIGPASHWGTAQVGNRQLVLYYDRQVASWSSLTLQVRCCSGCGQPPLSNWTFADTFQPLARRITGIAAAVDGDRLRLILARTTALQAASVPLATLATDTGAAMIPIHTTPPWMRTVAVTMPLVLIFFSFSLVYLGVTLARERRRALAEAMGVPLAPLRLHADVFQRIMAFILDQILIMPVLYLIFDAAALAPETATASLDDARFLAAAALGYAANVLYFSALEAWRGQTAGKWIVGIRVVTVDGRRAGLLHAFTRNALRFLDGYSVTALVGVVLIVTTRRRQRLGDMLARTMVVQADAALPPAPHG